MPDDIKTELDKLLAAASAPQGVSVSTPAAQPAPPLPATGTVQRVTSQAEFDAALVAAKGPTAVLFTQADCGYCEEDKKGLTELAAKCGAGSFTAIEVDASLNDELDKLATTWNVEGTPTLMFARTGAKMTPEHAEEVEVSSLRRKLKCARVKK